MLQKRPISKPDDYRSFLRGNIACTKLGGVDFTLATFEPGWHWAEHVQPLAQTELCEVPHLMYQITGTTHIRMRDGSELDIEPGDLAEIPAGHDAWVIGEQAATALDVSAATAEVYARP